MCSINCKPEGLYQQLMSYSMAWKLLAEQTTFKKERKAGLVPLSIISQAEDQKAFQQIQMSHFTQLIPSLNKPFQASQVSCHQRFANHKLEAF